MRRAIAALGIAATGACATPGEKVVPRATPSLPFSEILFVERGGSCALLYKTPTVEVRRSGRILFRLVNECASATGDVSFENFRVGREPVQCLDRTRPGSVPAKSERTYPTGVHPSRRVGDRCAFEIHVGGQKADPEIVIVP